MAMIGPGLQNNFREIATRRLPDTILAELERVQVGAAIVGRIAREIIGDFRFLAQGVEMPAGDRLLSTFFPRVEGAAPLSLEDLDPATEVIALATRSFPRVRYQFAVRFLLNNPVLSIETKITEATDAQGVVLENHCKVTFRGESAAAAAGVYQVAQYVHTYEEVACNAQGEVTDRIPLEPAEGSLAPLPPGAGDAKSIEEVRAALSAILDEAADGLGSSSESSDTSDARTEGANSPSEESDASEDSDVSMN